MRVFSRDLLFRDVTYYIEKYVLSSFMLYHAAKNLIPLVGGIDFLTHIRNPSGQKNLGPVQETVAYYHLIRYSLLFVFNAFNGTILLYSKRPHQAPKNWKAVVIPTLSSFSILAYNLTGYIPGWMRVNYVPERLLFSSLIMACLFTLAGQLMSLIAVLYLRRSFAIFIQLRDVVMNGPYRYVRHPMYTGYTLVAIGLLFSNFCMAYILISAVHIGLLAYRAHLEETMLATNDPGYRKNMERAGFLFPRLSLLLKGPFPS
jgi:protein-S-isoprenylcysteine O-methyltransferase Ste14